jgi:hypothetical protein
LISPQAFPGQVDAVCVVNEAIEDGVGVCWILDQRRMPLSLMGWCLKFALSPHATGYLATSCVSSI